MGLREEMLSLSLSSHSQKHTHIYIYIKSMAGLQKPQSGAALQPGASIPVVPSRSLGAHTVGEPPAAPTAPAHPCSAKLLLAQGGGIYPL